MKQDTQTPRLTASRLQTLDLLGKSDMLRKLLELIEQTGVVSNTTSGADFYAEVIELRELTKLRIEELKNGK